MPESTVPKTDLSSNANPRNTLERIKNDISMMRSAWIQNVWRYIPKTDPQTKLDTSGTLNAGSTNPRQISKATKIQNDLTHATMISQANPE